MRFSLNQGWSKDKDHLSEHFVLRNNLWPNVVVVSAYGAVGDGTTDDTAAIQAALNAVSGTGRTLLLPSGVYLISSALAVGSNTTVWGLRGAEIKLKAGSNCSVFTLANGISGVTLRGFKIDGDYTNQTNDLSDTLQRMAAVYASANVSDLRLEDMEICNMRGFAMRMMQSNSATNLWITGCYFHDTALAILELRSVGDATIQGNRFAAWSVVNNNNCCINLQDTCRRLNISNNVFYNTVGTQFGIESGSTGYNVVVDQSVIANNVFYDAALGGTGISGFFFRTTFSGNTFLNGVGTWRSGFELVGDHLTVVGNHIEEGRIVISGAVTGSRYVSVVGNSIKVSQENASGIHVGAVDANVTDVVVSGNTIQCTADCIASIWVGWYGGYARVNRVTVADNVITGRRIRLSGYAGTSDIIVARNIVSDSDDVGLYIDETGGALDKVQIFDNNFRDCATPVFGAYTSGDFYFRDNLGTNYGEVQTLTASGAVLITRGKAFLNHAMVAIDATKSAPTAGDELFIINTSASGTATHTVTLPVGVTWDGTNRIATLDAPGEALHVVAISATRFFILENIGSVAFS